MGTSGLTIDESLDPVLPQVITANSGSWTAFSSEAVAAVGRKRDMFVERTSGSLGVDFAANTIAGKLATWQAGKLAISSGTGTTEYGIVTWDEVDGANTLNATGLGGFNMTDSGDSTDFLFNRSGDFVGSLTFTIHSGGTRSLEITTTVPTAAAQVLSEGRGFQRFSGGRS